LNYRKHDFYFGKIFKTIIFLFCEQIARALKIPEGEQGQGKAKVVIERMEQFRLA